MVEHGDGDKPVYITQFGYSTEASREIRAGPRRRPGRLPRTAYDAATCTPLREGFSWYALT